MNQHAPAGIVDSDRSIEQLLEEGVTYCMDGHQLDEVHGVQPTDYGRQTDQTRGSAVTGLDQQLLVQ